MNGTRQPFLTPEEACDATRLKCFIEEQISPNAWPVHSKALLRNVWHEGLTPIAASDSSLSMGAARELLDRFERHHLRAERLLGRRVAFHHTLHNFEVLQRLLILDWPGTPPPDIEALTLQRVDSVAAIKPILLRCLEMIGGGQNLPSSITRNILAALGHDYGHTGGTDRTAPDGTPAPLSHEDAAERHVAKIGLAADLPAPLILQALAGIRATTFFRRPGRARIQAASDFERKLMLADVAGCVLPAADWLTFVAIPVFAEKIDLFERRRHEIPVEIERARREGDKEAKERIVLLEAERAGIVDNLAEWLKSETGFCRFVMEARLGAVSTAPASWTARISEKIACIQQAEKQEEAVKTLAAGGFPLLKEMVALFCNKSLPQALADQATPEAFQVAFAPFLLRRKAP